MSVKYQGGYMLLTENLVRGQGMNAHSARDLSKISDYTLDAVNLIQDTPWRVNAWMNADKRPPASVTATAVQ